MMILLLPHNTSINIGGHFLSPCKYAKGKSRKYRHGDEMMGFHIFFSRSGNVTNVATLKKIGIGFYFVTKIYYKKVAVYDKTSFVALNKTMAHAKK